LAITVGKLSIPPSIVSRTAALLTITAVDVSILRTVASSTIRRLNFPPLQSS